MPNLVFYSSFFLPSCRIFFHSVPPTQEDQSSFPGASGHRELRKGKSDASRDARPRKADFPQLDTISLDPPRKKHTITSRQAPVAHTHHFQRRPRKRKSSRENTAHPPVWGGLTPPSYSSERVNGKPGTQKIPAFAKFASGSKLRAEGNLAR